MASLKKFLLFFLVFVTALGEVPFASAITVSVSNQKGQNALLYSEQFDNAAWVKRGSSTVTANQIQAPDGTMTADLISGLDDLVVGDIYNGALGNSIGPPNARYEISVWIKRVSGSGTLRVVSGQSGRGYSVDLSLVGDGWVRIKSGAPGVSTYQGALFTMAGGEGGFDFYKGAGAGTLSFYAWGAQQTIGTKPGAYNRTTDTVFGSGYVPLGSTNSNQLGQNLITYSEQFDNAAWVKRGVATVTANQIANPMDGAMTADLISGLGANGANDIYGGYPLVIGPPNAVFTPSIWIKRVSTTGQLSLLSPSGNPGQFNVDLSLIGDDWIRVMKGVKGVTEAQKFTLTSAGAGGILLATNDGPMSFYAWGAQEVLGGKPGAYNPVVATKFNSSYLPAGATQSSQLGQNLITNSEQINNWSTGGGAVVTANAAMAPDGTRTADQIDYTVATDGYVYSGTGVMPIHTVGTQYTLSAWLWSSSTTKAQIGMRAYTLGGVLNGGSRSITLTTIPTRYSLTFTLTNAADTGIVLDLENRVPYGSDGLTGVMYVWGAQVVPGSKQGAYNRTTSASFNQNYVP